MAAGKVPNPRVDLPASLSAAILDQARRAGPRECCGLLEGVRGMEGFTLHALHPARNLAREADRFEIDPRDHFAAARGARRSGRTIVGCYHSHPDGIAAPSGHDLERAAEENFLWLIVAGDTITAFVYLAGAFVGADCVTSSE